jgi:membrane protease YdiL (CAAX protease family)
VFDPAEGPQTAPAVAPTVILPIRRLGAIVEILLCSGFPSQLLLITILTSLGLQLRTVDGQLSPPFVFTLSLADTVLVIALVFFFLHSHRERPKAVLLGSRAVTREVITGILLLPLIFVLVVGVLVVIFTLAPQLHTVPRNPLEDMLQNRRDALIFGVVAMIAGGVREEIQRGFILHRFDQYLGGGAVGVAIYSGLFGLGHIDQGLDAAIATALLGALWGSVYLVRRSVVAPMVSHAGFNLAQLIKFVAVR